MRPSYPFEAPEFGEIIPVAEGIDWLRLPLPIALDHINIYILHDADGVTIVDTGFKTPDTIAIWEKVIEEKIQRPIKRVLVTHYHPDHIGAAGWFAENHGAALWTSRMSYLLARMLQLDVQDKPHQEAIDYWRRAGYDEAWLEKRIAARPFNFLDSTHMLPIGVHTLLEGDVFFAAGREWIVRFGAGHAPDHVTLWSDDIVIIGDHCLPAITPVISVYPTEPYSDPISEFMETSIALSEFASDDQLFLPGHNRPFYGGHSRLLALSEHHVDNLEKLREALKKPCTMVECYPLLFRRKITPDLEGFAISEATAHFNYLWLRKEIEMVDDDGLIKWQVS